MRNGSEANSTMVSAQHSIDGAHTAQAMDCRHGPSLSMDCARQNFLRGVIVTSREGCTECAQRNFPSVIMPRMQEGRCSCLESHGLRKPQSFAFRKVSVACACGAECAQCDV